jgi:hypothetical protein
MPTRILIWRQFVKRAAPLLVVGALTWSSASFPGEEICRLSATSASDLQKYTDCMNGKIRDLEETNAFLADKLLKVLDYTTSNETEIHRVSEGSQITAARGSCQTGQRKIVELCVASDSHLFDARDIACTTSKIVICQKELPALFPFAVVPNPG